MRRLSAPTEVLASSFYHAVSVGLPDVVEQFTDHEVLYQMPSEARLELMQAADKGSAVLPLRTVQRRPQPSECSLVLMCPQMWESTRLGFGGLGGAAMTEAYTSVIQGPAGDLAVYFDGRHAYTVLANMASTEQQTKFNEDLAATRLVSVSRAEALYGATLARPRKASARQ